MRTYLVHRVLALLPTAVVVLFGVFVLVRYLPGDLATQRAGATVSSDEQIAAIRAEFDLDRPLYVQFGTFLRSLGTGDLGRSAWTERSVRQELLDRGLVTAELGGLALILSVILGIAVGTLSAVHRDTLLDYGIRTFSIVGLSLPAFWIGTMAVVVPVVWLGFSLPLRYTEPWEDPLNNFLVILTPACILAASLSAVTARYTRTVMLEVLNNDYIRTARAKGLRERAVVSRHALRNCAIPVVTIIGLQVPVIIGGSVVMERIFNIPGLGSLMLQSIEKRDYPMIQGLNLVFCLFVLTTNLVVDCTYGVLDPRTR